MTPSPGTATTPGSSVNSPTPPWGNTPVNPAGSPPAGTFSGLGTSNSLSIGSNNISAFGSNNTRLGSERINSRLGTNNLFLPTGRSNANPSVLEQQLPPPSGGATQPLPGSNP